MESLVTMLNVVICITCSSLGRFLRIYTSNGNIKRWSVFEMKRRLRLQKHYPSVLQAFLLLQLSASSWVSYSWLNGLDRRYSRSHSLYFVCLVLIFINFADISVVGYSVLNSYIQGMTKLQEQVLSLKLLIL